jgi:hypothetical protein
MWCVQRCPGPRGPRGSTRPAPRPGRGPRGPPPPPAEPRACACRVAARPAHDENRRAAARARRSARGAAGPAVRRGARGRRPRRSARLRDSRRQRPSCGRRHRQRRCDRRARGPPPHPSSPLPKRRPRAPVPAALCAQHSRPGPPRRAASPSRPPVPTAPHGGSCTSSWRCSASPAPRSARLPSGASARQRATPCRSCAYPRARALPATAGAALSHAGRVISHDPAAELACEMVPGLQLPAMRRRTAAPRARGAGPRPVHPARPRATVSARPCGRGAGCFWSASARSGAYSLRCSAPLAPGPAAPRCEGGPLVA